MKKFLAIFGILILAVVLGALVFIFTFQPKTYSDFGVFDNLKQHVLEELKSYSARERAITAEFSSFVLDLSFPFNKVFGSKTMAIPLKAFQNDSIGTATISQFEVPPHSSYFRDFTFHIRPQYGIRAPVFHIDFMKPAPGTSGMCNMDFFNPDPDSISIEEFLGPELENVRKALALVADYQKTPEQGRGKITKFLDPHKSAFRFELKEPASEDEAIRKAYYRTVEQAVLLVIPAYLKRLHATAPDAGYAAAHEAKTKALVRLFYRNDMAVSLGKRVFKDHFQKYWMDGFWNVRIVPAG